ncbi:MAG: thioredoxin fold domain-containing protein [Chitinophagales bacterium]|nr:thioredoxin fold domain-containing protein [Chitinophagales bacterium]
MNTATKSSQEATKNKAALFWKFFWLSFLVLSLAYAGYSFYSPSNQIEWAKPISSIEELSNSSSNKNTLLFFTGKWCSPCQIMKREVFADSEVEKIVNAKLHAIQIDIASPSTIEIVNYYKVAATPTSIIVNNKGEVLDYAVGKMDKNQFLEMLKHAESKK